MSVTEKRMPTIRFTLGERKKYAFTYAETYLGPKPSYNILKVREAKLLARRKAQIKRNLDQIKRNLHKIEHEGKKLSRRQINQFQKILTQVDVHLIAMPDEHSARRMASLLQLLEERVGQLIKATN